MSKLILYVFSFMGAVVLGALLTSLARALAYRLKFYDRPAGRKNHAKPTPLTGGWGVFASFLLFAGAGGLLGPFFVRFIPESLEPLPHYLENLRGVRKELFAILLGASWIFVIGLIDDVRPLGPKFKLFAQVLAVVPLIAAGISIRVFLPWPWLGWIVTIIWSVVLMNSFNFMDNMDGLTATVGAVIAAVLAIAAGLGGQFWMPALFLAFAGILVGFLLFNFNPASIFLGDSGALTIGYLLAVFSILTTYYESDLPSGLPVLIPLAVMGVPLFDTASVLWIRWRNGTPLMVGDHNHFSHRLRALGFSVRQTVVTIGLLTGAIGLLSLALRYLDRIEALLHLSGIVMLFAVIGALEFFGRRRKE